MTKEIPLNCLIIDKDNGSINVLGNGLKRFRSVLNVHESNSLEHAKFELKPKLINVIFIDPFAFELDNSSKFIFSVRDTLPEIVFILFYNYSRSEYKSSIFYDGERARFKHYYKLDKQTIIGKFSDELLYTHQLIQNDLEWRMSSKSINNLLHQSNLFIENKPKSENNNLIIELKNAVDLLLKQTQTKKATTLKKSIFISYKFAETDYIEGLIELCKLNGYTVITGNESNRSISNAIISRIKECEYFLCLMTKDKEKTDGTYTTSPWLLEEKGVALAMEKKIVLLIEEGVSDYGGLQGDWQLIHFSPKGFTMAIQKAIKQLKSFEEN